MGDIRKVLFVKGCMMAYHRLAEDAFRVRNKIHPPSLSGAIVDVVLTLAK